MENLQSFNHQNLSAFVQILGSMDKHLPEHIWEELENFCNQREEWTWNTFERIFVFINTWINQYNKSLDLPVLASMAAIKKENDRIFFILSDLYFATLIQGGELLFIGQRISQNQSVSVHSQKEILVPAVLLGAFDLLPAHINDEVLDGELLIFDRNSDILKIKAIFEESGFDFDSFCEKLKKNGFKFIGWR